MDDLDRQLNNIYPGRAVRKDLTKRIREGASVPVYVLEYLLGMVLRHRRRRDDRAGRRASQANPLRKLRSPR